MKRPSFLEIPIVSQAAGENAAATHAPHQVGWVSMGWETLRIKTVAITVVPNGSSALIFSKSQLSHKNAAATHFFRYLPRSACMWSLYHTCLGNFAALNAVRLPRTVGKSWATERTFWRLNVEIRFRQRSAVVSWTYTSITFILSQRSLRRQYSPFSVICKRHVAPPDRREPTSKGFTPASRETGKPSLPCHQKLNL